MDGEQGFGFHTLAIVPRGPTWTFQACWCGYSLKGWRTAFYRLRWKWHERYCPLKEPYRPRGHDD